MDRKINKQNLNIQIAQAIISEIKEGRWAVGSRIPIETELAELCGVSRSMVREATKILESNGILASKTGAGTFVQPSALSNIQNMEFFELLRSDINFATLYDVRVQLEPCLAYYAALRCTEADIEEGMQLLNVDKTALEHETDSFQTTMPFHLWIAKTARNEISASFLQATMQQIASTKYAEVNAHLLLATKETGIQEHLALLDAIRKHDAKLAHFLMMTHLLDRIDWIETPYRYPEKHDYLHQGNMTISDKTN